MERARLSKLVLLMRRLQLARDPASHIRLKRVAGQDPGFAVSAPAAFEGAVFEAFGPRCNGNRDHPRLTVRAARTVNRQ